MLLGEDDQLLRADDLTELQAFSRHPDQPPLPAAKDREGLWGYLNVQGQWAMTPQWNKARAFTQDGLARVEKNGLWSYVGTDLKTRIKPTWTQASTFVRRRAVVRMPDASTGLIDTTGASVVSTRYRLIGNFAVNGFARAATQDDRWGYIDRQGNRAFDTTFDLVLDFNGFPVAPAGLKDRWGLIDTSGR